MDRFNLIYQVPQHGLLKNLIHFQLGDLDISKIYTINFINVTILLTINVL